MPDQRKSVEELQNELAELRQAYNILKAREEQYRVLTEYARDVIWTMKPDGTITYISPAVEQMRGLTVEEAMRQPIDQILNPDSIEKVIEYLRQLNVAIEAGAELPAFRGELEYYKKDGSTLWTEVLTYPIRESDGISISILGVTRDISERKDFEAKLMDQAKQMKEVNATKDKFFSIIAHDLQSPFNLILGFSQLLKSEAGYLDMETIVKYAEVIFSSAEHTFKLLENLLDWAKTQREGFPFEPSKVLINNLISYEISRQRAFADQKNIRLVHQSPENLVTRADEKMISTIIRNLVSNAIKFTPKNGSVRVEAKKKNGSVEISVSDNGIGMNPETVAKLFQIETSFTLRGTDNEKGSGLGLILCQEFARKHGSRILVESKIGEGSRFWFSVPLAKGDSN